LGRLTDTPTPHIDSIYAAVALLNENLPHPVASANGQAETSKTTAG